LRVQGSRLGASRSRIAPLKYRRRGIIGAALLAAALPSPASAITRPTARDQALHDGCQRSDLSLGLDTTPEWVYVNRDPTMRMATGVVRIAHPSLGESVLEHRSYDFTANLVPDKPFGYLIAGSQSAGTNNFAPGGGEEFGRLHFEWESATLPAFAWPTDGDRAALWGSWIWDCGHRTSVENNVGGVVTGEHTELHPLNGIAVSRKAPFLSARGESETDVFISNEGTAAHAIEQCALSHHPINPIQYDAGFEPCARSTANQLQPLAKSYSFFVPAPRKPAPGARLVFRVVNRISGGSGSERVRTKGRGIEVTVTLHGAKHVVSYGKSFFVGWTKPPRRPPVALKVTLKSILIKQADPNPAVPDPTGAHWNLYMDLNGSWQLLNKWAPRLTTNVVDGEQININRAVKLYVPHGAKVSLMVQGRECDEPAGRSVLGVYANLLYPCPANTDELNPNILDSFNNDDPGTILDVYRSAGAAVGTHTSTSRATVNFPGIGPITFGDGKMGEGDYQLSSSVRKG
jgi:hypothetical protein